MLKTVIFDMDGTILDSERFCFECMREAFGQKGKEFTEEEYKHVIGGTREGAIQYFRSLFGESLDYTEIWREEEALEEERFARGDGVPLKAGYTELASWLKEQKIQSILATSTSRKKAEKRLELAGILGNFDFMVCGDEVKKGKPDPEIYLQAVARSQTEASEIMVIEDSFNGVRAACGAGLRVIMVPDMIAPSEEIKKLIYAQTQNLREVISVLAGV